VKTATAAARSAQIATLEKLVLGGAYFFAEKSKARKPIRPAAPQSIGGEQAEQMAAYGWIKITAAVAERLFSSGSEIAILGKRDQARSRPKTIHKSEISWDVALSIVEGKRASLPVRDQKLAFFVKAAKADPR
jgi:hypothetical protein